MVEEELEELEDFRGKDLKVKKEMIGTIIEIDYIQESSSEVDNKINPENSQTE